MRQAIRFLRDFRPARRVSRCAEEMLISSAISRHSGGTREYAARCGPLPLTCSFLHRELALCPSSAARLVPMLDPDGEKRSPN